PNETGTVSWCWCRRPRTRIQQRPLETSGDYSKDTALPVQRWNCLSEGNCGQKLQAAFFLGTLAPFFRASDNPIAIACLRIFTVPPFPPFPERSVPFFFRRIALATVLPAALPYLRPDLFAELFFTAINSPRLIKELRAQGALVPT